MERYGRLLKSLVPLVLVLFYCGGCAVPGPAGKSGKAPSQTNVQEGSAKASPAEAPVKKTDHILGVQIQDQPDETIVQVLGNAPFQDYEFRRLGEDRFALELGGIKKENALPSLPTASERVKLIYADPKSPDTVQIIGSFRNPLDRYVLNNLGNDLVLMLYFSKQPASSLGKDASAHQAVTGALSSGESEETFAPAVSSSPPKAKKGSTAKSRKPPTPRVQTVNVPRVERPPLPEPPTSAGPLKKQYTGKPISLDLLDADLRNVLRLLSDITATNIVIEPDVAGRVTLKVERVPWDQVLDMILGMNDLGKEQVGNVIRIARQGKLKQEWNQAAEEIRAKQELMEVAKDVGDINIVYLTVNYSQPAEIAAKINENKSDKGKVSVDDRSSLIIYSDYPSRIENARRLLARLDRATPQVLIEARIVTMTNDSTKALGVTWNVNFQALNSANRNTLQTREFQVNQPGAINPLLGFSMTQIISDTLVDLDFKLNALETTTQATILASPKVLTLNHVKATITQGRQVPYLKLSDLNVASTEFKDATLELQVTPHITPDKKVRLEIMAKQDEPTVQEFTVGSSSVPAIDTRKINTELLVDDGNIVVIGGVIRRTDQYKNVATPGLHNIPLLGWLFKSQTKTLDRSELLIFISPRIVEASGPPDRV